LNIFSTIVAQRTAYKDWSWVALSGRGVWVVVGPRALPSASVGAALRAEICRLVTAPPNASMRGGGWSEGVALGCIGAALWADEFGLQKITRSAMR